MRVAATKAVNDISLLTKSINDEQTNSYELLDRYTTYIILVSVAIYYLLYALIRGMVYDPEVFVVAVAAVLILLSSKGLLRSLRVKVESAKFRTLESVQTTRVGLAQLNGHKLGIETNLEPISSTVQNGWNLTEKVVGTFREYILVL